jgi:hypothetical protein
MVQFEDPRLLKGYQRALLRQQQLYLIKASFSTSRQARPQGITCKAITNG